MATRLSPLPGPFLLFLPRPTPHPWGKWPWATPRGWLFSCGVREESAHAHTHTRPSDGLWHGACRSTGMAGRGSWRKALQIHTGIELRVMLINLTAISTGFWIREDSKRKGAG